MLTILNKIFEEAINSRIRKFPFLLVSVYGFKTKNWDLVILELIHKITFDLNFCKNTTMIFLDLSKKFCCRDHLILLWKHLIYYLLINVWKKANLLVFLGKKGQVIVFMAIYFSLMVYTYDLFWDILHNYLIADESKL